jgi:hypothetical protein
MSTDQKATTDNCPECGASLPLNGQPTTPTVDHVSGYRLLAVGETIEDGDEFLDYFKDKWRPRYGGVGYVQADCFRPTRHRVPAAPQPEPEPGFVLLGSGDVLDADDHYWSPGTCKWYSGTSAMGRTVADALQELPKGAAYARRVPAAATLAPGQLVEVLGGLPWCLAPHGEWVRDFSRPVLVGSERYRTVTRVFGVEDGDCVLLDDGYDYPATALQAVQAKWRPWAPEEALGQRIRNKDLTKTGVVLVTVACARGIVVPEGNLNGWTIVDYGTLFSKHEQLDGSPCGVLGGYEAI